MGVLSSHENSSRMTDWSSMSPHENSYSTSNWSSVSFSVMSMKHWQLCNNQPPEIWCNSVVEPYMTSCTTSVVDAPGLHFWSLGSPHSLTQHCLVADLPLLPLNQAVSAYLCTVQNMDRRNGSSCYCFWLPSLAWTYHAALHHFILQTFL